MARADRISWDEFEIKYAKLFPSDTGNVAKPPRTATGRWQATLSNRNGIVFFADEKTALAAGFRLCGNCLREKYKEYMADPQKYQEKLAYKAGGDFL